MQIWSCLVLRDFEGYQQNSAYCRRGYDLGLGDFFHDCGCPNPQKAPTSQISPNHSSKWHLWRLYCVPPLQPKCSHHRVLATVETPKLWWFCCCRNQLGQVPSVGGYTQMSSRYRDELMVFRPILYHFAREGGHNLNAHRSDAGRKSDARWCRVFFRKQWDSILSMLDLWFFVGLWVLEYVVSMWNRLKYMFFCFPGLNRFFNVFDHSLGHLVFLAGKATGSCRGPCQGCQKQSAHPLQRCGCHRMRACHQYKGAPGHSGWHLSHCSGPTLNNHDQALQEPHAV